MLPAERIVKQITALVIFVIIFGGLGFLAYEGLKPSAPTPTPPPILNLTPVYALSSKLFNVQNNDYDFVAKVKNPNQEYGSDSIQYELSLWDNDDELILRKYGTFYIMPGQTKYIADLPMRLSRPAVRHDFKVVSINWLKVGETVGEDVSLVVRNITYSQPPGESFFSKAAGNVYNNSDFDLGEVGLVAVAFNSSGEPIAVNKTIINTFLAKTSRGFELKWQYPFVGSYSTIEIEANTNIFENANFIRRLGEQERFQQLY
ncbi:MAG: hypothetical protein Q8Q06_00425 [bacterium]|nr:hypothetical protein [bacterium]